MQTIRLSEATVATLRFEIKGWKERVRDQDLPAYGELVEAGIMEPDGERFRFTEDGLVASAGHPRSGSRSGSSGSGMSHRTRVAFRRRPGNSCGATWRATGRHRVEPPGSRFHLDGAPFE